jgi:hypothetical protein
VLPFLDLAGGDAVPTGAALDALVDEREGVHGLVAERRDLDIAESVATFLDARFPRRAGPWAELIDLAGEPEDARPAPMLDATAAEIDLRWHSGGFHAGLDRALNWMLQRFAPAAAPALAAE